MDESRVLARLDRIDALDRSGAPAAELLAELRGLLRDAEAQRPEPRTAASGGEGVVARLGTAQHRT